MKKHKIAILSADYPNFMSGYGDYAYMLVKHLENLGEDICLVTSDASIIDAPPSAVRVKWRIRDIPTLYATLKHKNIRIINIQYPNILYGRYSLLPHCYAIILRILGFKIVTTIHEYSNVNVVRRLSELVFFIFSNRLVVTSDLEQQKIKRLFGPIVRDKAQTINIGSNIECTNAQPNYSSNVIVTFGMFYPDRRVEEVIDFMEQIDSKYKGQFVYRFIGGVHVHYQDYFARCKSIAENKLRNVEWVVNRSITEVSGFLHDAFIGIVFYNDGASIRRGSLLALMNHGLPIITNKVGIPVEFATVENMGLFYANDKGHPVLDDFEKLKRHEGFYRDCFNNLLSASKNYSFDKIAQEYLQIFCPEKTIDP